MLNTRSALWCLGVVVALTGACAEASSAESDSAVARWTGTITVTRRVSGAPAEGLEATINVEAEETVTWTLLGDGSADVRASYSERQVWGAKGISMPIVTSGSGGVMGIAGAVREEPDASAQALLGVTPGWAVVAETLPIRVTQDRSGYEAPMRRFFGELVRALSLGAGPPLPDASAAEKEDWIHEYEYRPQPVEVKVSAPPDAQTLRGSRSLPVELGEIPMMGTQVVTWDLTRAPVRAPAVAIRGPGCGCIDPANPERTPLRFSAFANVEGGEFTAFTLRSEGKAPEVRVNEGGERPSLEIVGSRDTGAVTLEIAYQRNGRTLRAAPFRVEFCAIETPEIGGGRTDIAFSRDSVLRVEASSHAWYNGKPVDDELEWTIDRMGQPSQLTSNPGDARGRRVEFRYEGLPERNSDFGPKVLAARHRTGQCDCAQPKRIRTFFIADVHGNPGEENVPNWFFYWRQTEAAPEWLRGMLRYEPVPVNHHKPKAKQSPFHAIYDAERGTITLGDTILVPHPKGCIPQQTPDGVMSGRVSEGIDCFGETVRHELQHHADAIEWWGSPKGMYSVSPVESWLKDGDLDNVPNSVEIELDCDPGRQRSCPNLLVNYPDATDAEVRAYDVGWTWPVGSVDSEDWSCGPLAKQWRGGACN